MRSEVPSDKHGGRGENGRRGGGQQKAAAASGAWLPSTHPGVCKVAALLDYTRIYSLKAHKDN